MCITPIVGCEYGNLNKTIKSFCVNNIKSRDDKSDLRVMVIPSLKKYHCNFFFYKNFDYKIDYIQNSMPKSRFHTLLLCSNYLGYKSTQKHAGAPSPNKLT